MLRRDMGRYDTVEAHTRLERHAWLGVNAPWMVIIVSRMPTEYAEIEAFDSSDVTIDYDYDIEDFEDWAAMSTESE